jgi:hypothetical protein
MIKPFFILAVLLFAVSVMGQRPQATPTESYGEPSLPVIDYNACPFEGCTFGKWKVTKNSTLFSSWQQGRSKIGRLNLGEEVIGVAGVHITRKPDGILVKRAIPDLDARPGDTILRYMYVGEGFANIWIHGQWHKEYDCTFVSEKDDGGCSRDCSASVAEYGMKEWWVKISTHDGKTGWVRVEDNFDGMDSLAGLGSQTVVYLPD